MSAPCLLLSVVAGWVTITMEVIISHQKWEHPHWTIYRVKNPKVPQVPQRDAFSLVQFKTAMNSCAEVLGLPVHNENSESRVFLLKDWIAFLWQKAILSALTEWLFQITWLANERYSAGLLLVLPRIVYFLRNYLFSKRKYIIPENKSWFINRATDSTESSAELSHGKSCKSLSGAEWTPLTDFWFALAFAFVQWDQIFPQGTHLQSGVAAN